ncbi:MAG TPA: carboxypeptidase-like regulatory domain-containing protein [Bacteroidales bacterium]|nr:carboxypeptidase-like regulatory domain-containing protein [Bacteroidales bacterium]HQL70602.1 carboxypeptidase-like regulatory domain-containing protein [Bacteroidales bacterium]
MLRLSKILVLIPTLLLAVTVWSQQVFTLTGKAYDVETGDPVPLCNVFAKSGKNGTVCDAMGRFTMRGVKTGDTIVLSHVQYKTTEFIADSRKPTTETALEPNVTQLPQAEVRPVVNISKGMVLDVFDYTFVGDNILYAGYCYRYTRENNPWLVMISPRGDTVFTKCVRTEGHFFADCLGNLHYLTEVNAYQLVFDEAGVSLEYPMPLKKFLEIMEPCKLESDGKLLFGEYAENDQVLMYYYTDTVSLEWEMFRTIADERKLEMLAYQGRFFSMGTKPPTEADMRFEKMMYKPVFAPILKLNDTIAIINYTDSVIEWYNTRFRKLGQVNINFQNNRYIENQIAIDEITGNVYAVYLKNGKSYVREIFISTGSIGKEIKIPDFYWVSDITVWDDALYFLYREKYSGDFRALYKMKIR